MTLYHFTAAHMLKPILERGLVLGGTPVVVPGEHGKRLALIQGTQWLTTNGDFKQDWCDPLYSNLPYDSNAFRLRIEIPNGKRSHLFTWEEFYRLHVAPHGYEKVEGFDDREHCNPDVWRIYVGVIYPLWIKNFLQNRDGFRSIGQGLVV